MQEKTSISIEELKNMVQLGAQRLNEKAEQVNALNVFPVPDGDTGTNMSLSFNSGADRVATSPNESISQLANNLAKGLLMGARGNSGVILSQLFRGFAKSLEGKEVLTASELAQAFQAGVDTAYKAVMKPVEGTILTVSRISAKKALKKSEETNDCLEVLSSLLKGARAALAQTPDLLPVLKEVGVVDSGGQGLVYIYEGFYEALTGVKPSPAPVSVNVDLSSVAHHDIANVSTGDIKYGYCTEIMVQIGEGETVVEKFDETSFRNYLNDLGDSLLVVNDDEIIKVHVHTEHPGQVLNYGQRFGSLVKVKVDNMRLQNDDFIKRDSSAEIVEKAKSKQPYAIIAVSTGEGLNNLFKSVGVTHIISGGQTMNPSTEVIVKEIEKANAEKVIILPNNKNIFMAAHQAAEVAEAEVAVVETKSLTAGLSAMIAFNPDADLESNVADMTDSLKDIVNGQITRAIRSTTIDGVEINENDYMGIVDGKIKISVPDLADCLTQTIDKMVTIDSEIVTIITGEDVKEEVNDQIMKDISIRYPDLELDIYPGDQPVYHYLISVE
ncbi:DAK2 domain-containing protein [Atopobacter sp. AH10]|uniref:DAK2 domain-containing protein n=1 Tax=Atopobacter sp. AH10 TaxID=2315861 RepID=UPI000EF186A8|nr:DAK2 domain-containing protein [Atopobacter sp. AH10]RLK63295.1 DAK2 domain-containing protein [Atopobacter sp. AH10]